MQPAPKTLERSPHHIETAESAGEPHVTRGTNLLLLGRRLFALRRAPAAIVLAALVLTSSALTLRLTADDYIHLLGVRPESGIEGLTLRPWDLFAFARGEPESAHGLMNEGAFPWWSDPTCMISFFRPLSSLTHWIDYSLWPTQNVLTHLHSYLWFALLLIVVARVYQQLTPAPWIGSLALFFYALDDARAPAVGWVATRNLVIALALGLLALSAHHRARADGDVRSKWLAPLWLALALLGGESAIQVCAYLFAYALFLERGSLLARLRTLLPYAGVVLIWRIPYGILRHGAQGSGLYFDPAREPLAYLDALSERLPVILLAQFWIPMSDLWDTLPVLAPGTQIYMLLTALAVVAVMVYLLWPLFLRDRLLRFWSAGALLASLPVCAGPLDDRLLLGPGVGFMMALAQLLAALADGSYPHKNWFVKVAGVSLALFHGVAEPLFLPVRTWSVDSFEGFMAHADPTVPSDASVTEKSVVVMNPPVDLFAMYFPFYREAKHTPRPKHFRWLANGVCDLKVTRTDEHTLVVRPSKGFLSNSTQWMLRGRRNPMKQGEQVALADATFTVTELTADARPAEVEVRFVEPLESPKLHWLQWGRQEYVPFTPPKVGETVVIPAVDMEVALLGG